ncbi:murein biosynthesis integral membrane protein MurJ [Pseudonocardia sp.]|uniref:murein biosynthesis integral membrane protein MurJ n=1 Tax=Pseudonocardia sp. TaxID=60912 RepID=UPI00260AA8E4|nr:murein biosynthesis integral membrane protein MurJ [Pseudonocardia sp.]
MPPTGPRLPPPPRPPAGLPGHPDHRPPAHPPFDQRGPRPGGPIGPRPGSPGPPPHPQGPRRPAAGPTRPRSDAAVPPPWSDSRRPGGATSRPAPATRRSYEPPPGADDATQIFSPVVDAEPARPSLGRSSSRIALASLVSRLTGFLRQIAIVAVLSIGAVSDSYTVANTLPVIVYQLLIGGVLSSVLVPVLVRAQVEDDDEGEAYTRRLLTLAGLALLVATVLAVLAAPLLSALYTSGAGEGATPELTTAFLYLLLPQIFFFGIGALFGAILNSRGVFGPFAWAPVLNNVVVLVVLGVFTLVPGEISVDPVRMGEPKLLVLGIGVTMGIVVQALVLIPALRRLGVRYRPVWGIDARLKETVGLAAWVLLYVAIGQLGYLVMTRVTYSAAPGSLTAYSNTWLLLQVPYGILGVSLLTALMPRMSRAAAEGRPDDVVSDLSLGARLSAVFLIPISALITVFGTPVALALFGLRSGNIEGAQVIGTALTVSAFGLLPYAITMLQLRVFYAMSDSRTPTLLQTATIGFQIPVFLALGALLPPESVVLGLAAANGVSYVFAAVLGQIVLRRRLGTLPTSDALGTMASTTVAALLGTFVAFGATTLLPIPDSWPPAAGAWVTLVFALIVAAPAVLLAMRLLRVREVDPLVDRIVRLAGRRIPGRRPRR